MENIVVEFVRESMAMQLNNKARIVSGIDVVIDKAINPDSESIKDMCISIEYIQCRVNVPVQDTPLYRSPWLFQRRLVC